MRIFAKAIPFFIISTAAFFVLFSVLFPQEGKIIYGGDLLLQFYYWKGFLVDSVKSGVIPFWNPYLFSGTPFLSHPAVAPFSLGTLILFLFPYHLSFSWIYFFHFLVAGTGMYYLTRNYCNRVTSVISSLLFILSGYFAARIYAGHVDLFTTAVFIPWVFASFVRERTVQTTISLVFLIFAGYSAYLIFTVEFMGLFTLFKCFGNKKNALIFIRNLIVPIFFAVSISAIAWIPTYELAKNSIRGEGLPYDIASWGSLPVSGIKLFLNPFDRTELNKISFNIGGGPQENPFDHFVGVTPLIVVIGGILIGLLSNLISSKGKKGEIFFLPSDFWFFAAVSFFVVWMSLGYFAPVNIHKVFYLIFPMYRMIRIPLQHLVLVVILIPVMAAITINKLPVIVRIAVGLLMCCELFIWGKHFIFLTDVPDRVHNQKLLSDLGENQLGSRILPSYGVVSPILSDMDLNAYLRYKIPSTGGYDPVILKNYFQFLENSSGLHNAIMNFNVETPPVPLTEDIISFLGINWIVAGQNADVEKKLPDFRLYGEGGGYKLYKNSKTNVFYSFTAGSGESGCESKAEIIPSDANSYKFRTKSKCDGTFITSIPYYPGWKVFVDGEEDTLILNHAAFDGVSLSKGDHTVEIKYVPYIYYWAGVVSLIGIMGFAGMIRYKKI